MKRNFLFIYFYIKKGLWDNIIENNIFIIKTKDKTKDKI
jgi:hypothetical protein